MNFPAPYAPASFDLNDPALVAELADLLDPPKPHAQANGNINGHTQVSYGGRVSADVLLHAALKRVAPGSLRGRNYFGFWLSLMLRDEGYSHDEAVPVLKAYAASVPQVGHPYTERQALASLRSAYLRGPRERLGAASTAPQHPPCDLADLIGSDVFAARSYPLKFLVDHVLVADQPMLVAGAKKVLKTGTLLDLSVSLATGGYVYKHSHFRVGEACNVGLISGESGEGVLQATANAICAAKGVKLAEVRGRLRWGFRLPRLSNPEHLRWLQRQIKAGALRVIVIDPLYLCLLAGNAAVNPGDLLAMGPLLYEVATACLDVGATPVLCHHVSRGSQKADPFKVPDLDDVAFAGFPEFARQWVLLGRRRRYEPGTGHHALWMNVGGSAGHSSLWEVNIDEGTPDLNFQGKRWSVSVEGVGGSVAPDKPVAGPTKDGQDDAKVLAALAAVGAAGASRNALKPVTKLSGSRIAKAVSRLLAAGAVEPAPGEHGALIRLAPGATPGQPV